MKKRRRAECSTHFPYFVAGIGYLRLFMSDIDSLHFRCWDTRIMYNTIEGDSHIYDVFVCSSRTGMSLGLTSTDSDGLVEVLSTWHTGTSGNGCFVARTIGPWQVI